MSAAPTILCSCGETAAHVIARRKTFDEKIVLLWSDGSITWALGRHIKGSAQPRTVAQVRAALRAGWLVLGEVCLYVADEVSALVAAARWAVTRDGLPGTMRARLRAQQAAASRLRPHWVTQETDPHGRVTVRVWRLPRLLDASLAVFHERGRYWIGRRVAEDTYASTGFKFATQSAMLDALPGLLSRGAQ